MLLIICSFSGGDSVIFYLCNLHIPFCTPSCGKMRYTPARNDYDNASDNMFMQLERDFPEQ